MPRPEPAQPVKPVCRGRGRDNARACSRRELDREQGDAARPLGEHGAARADRMLLDDRDPGGQRGARQRRGLDKIEVSRDGQNRVLAEYAVFAGDAVDRSAERRGEPLFVRRTALPAGEKATDHPVAHAPARDACSDFDDFARPIGEGHEVAALLLRAVAAVDGDEVAIIERGGPQAHQHFTRARTRLWPLDNRQVVETKGFCDGDFHRRSMGCGERVRQRP